MINLTDDAQKTFDQYLQQVRTCLRSCKTVDADEIEQNITEHIETELAGTEEPVTNEALDPVLKKLGSPTQWIPEQETDTPPITTAPFILTYISFGLLIVFVALSMPYTLATLLWRPFLETFLLFPGNLLIISFILARVALCKVWSPKDLGRKRWLAYCPLILIYIRILPEILLLPVIIIHLFWLPYYMAYLSEMPQEDIQAGLEFVMFMKIGSVGLWCVALGVILMRRTKIVHKIFSPFANWFNRKHAIALLLTGLVIVGVVIVGYRNWYDYLSLLLSQ